MSITIIKPITVDDYVEVFPNTQDRNRVERAINLSFFIIDGITNGAITERWNKGSTEEGHLTEEQKDLVKKAFVVQTQYVIQCNLDLTNQSQSMSIGGLSLSTNKPQINQLCEAARNYLKKADLFYKTEFLGPKSGSYVFDDLKYYVTYSVGDKRYLMTKDKTQTHWNKYIFINSQGDIEYHTITEVKGKATWGKIDGQLEDQTDLWVQLTYLDDFCEALDSTKAPADSVYTKLQVDELIATSSAEFLGSYVGGETRPTTFDYDTFIREHLPTGTAVTANDYVFVIWSDENEYDRCKYNATTETWIFEFTFRGGNVVPYITIESPSTATSGTLTSEQLLLLQSSNNSYILFNNEKYYLNDLQHTYGSLGYTHTGYENGSYIIKNITITISTLGWVLSTWNSMNSLWPVNSIWTTINASDDPNTIWPGTTWQLISTQSYIPNLPNVFGNGTTFGVTNGTLKGGFGNWNDSASAHSYVTTRVYGQPVGTSTASPISETFGTSLSLGVLTKDILTEATYHYTGLELDTTQVYMWKRTA